MKFQGKIVSIHHESMYKDHRNRIAIRLDVGNQLDELLVLPINGDEPFKPELGMEVTITIASKLTRD